MGQRMWIKLNIKVRGNSTAQTLSTIGILKQTRSAYLGMKVTGLMTGNLPMTGKEVRPIYNDFRAGDMVSRLNLCLWANAKELFWSNFMQLCMVLCEFGSENCVFLTPLPTVPWIIFYLYCFDHHPFQGNVSLNWRTL